MTSEWDESLMTLMDDTILGNVDNVRSFLEDRCIPPDDMFDEVSDPAWDQT